MNEKHPNFGCFLRFRLPRKPILRRNNGSDRLSASKSSQKVDWSDDTNVAKGF
jgi:hypothetical protein